MAVATASRVSRAESTNPWVVLVLVCLAQFMVVLDATIVNVALPSMQSDLGFSQTSLQWVVNIYTLVFGGFLLLGGRAGDLFGRKRLFIAGVAVFTVASAIDGLSTSPGMLIAARALQGLGAALVSPAALSIVTTTFAEGRDRARALGVWSAIAVGGGAIGLILGGILTEYLSWRWNFFVNLPVGVATILLSLRFVPDSRASVERRGFDLAGAVTVTGGLMLIVYGLVGATDHGWGSTRTLGILAAGLALLAAFVWVERRSAHPLVRLSIFRQRWITAANATMLAVAGGIFAVFFFASLYVQDVLNFTPVEAGLGFLPLTAAIILAAGLAQRLVVQIGVKPVALTGMSIAAVGLVLLSFISVGGSYAVDVLPGLVVLGLGLGLTFVPLTLIATSGIQADDAGLASGLFNSSQQVGGALGLAILSTLAAHYTTSSLQGAGAGPTPHEQAVAAVSGYQAAFLAAAGLMALGVILVATLVRRRDVVPATASEPVVVGA
jgi:EmrB/QacA subfamily drug resistance transporter